MIYEHAPRKVAFLMKRFPRLSETFILNEILGLEKLGMELEIFSLRRPADEPVHPGVSSVKARIHYIPSINPDFRLGSLFKIVSDHARLAFSDRRRYLKSLLFHFRQPGRRHLNDFLQAGSLACDIKRAAFAHLHVHFANVPATVGELVQSLCGIPFSVTAHAKDIYLTPPGELARKMRKATCVLTCTAYNQRYLAGLNHGDTPIHLAHHGIDAGRFGGATEQTAESDGEAPLILSVGRFCEKKGFEYLIAACQILKQRGREFRCLIIGYGELQEKLEKMISALGLAGCVSLPGRMTQGQLAALYPKSSMFVLPCLVTDNGDRDGIPNVMIEAMASRVPVISTNISGIAELVEDGKNGLLVEQRNVQQIAAAVENLLLQPALRKHMGNMGHEKVMTNFTLESSGARVFHILEEAMSGAQKKEFLSGPRVVAVAS